LSCTYLTLPPDIRADILSATLHLKDHSKQSRRWMNKHLPLSSTVFDSTSYHAAMSPRLVAVKTPGKYVVTSTSSGELHVARYATPDDSYCSLLSSTGESIGKATSPSVRVRAADVCGKLRHCKDSSHFGTSTCTTMFAHFVFQVSSFLPPNTPPPPFLFLPNHINQNVSPWHSTSETTSPLLVHAITPIAAAADGLPENE
jgi:hypothetical protein